MEVSQENGVESRKELDAFVELDPVAEITEVGTKEVLPDTPQPEPQPQPEPPNPDHTSTSATTTARPPQPQPLPNPEHPHVSEGPVATATPQASLEVKAVRQEGDRCSREGSRENSSNTSSFSCSSFRR